MHGCCGTKALARAATQALQAWCSEQALRLRQSEGEGITAAANEPASTACRKHRTISLKQANQNAARKSHGRVGSVLPPAASNRQRRIDAQQTCGQERCAQTNKKRRSRAAQFQTSNRHSKRPQPRYAFPISDFRFPIPDSRFPKPPPPSVLAQADPA
ncbi:hypothetical protein XAC3218_180163 [Xanthomonas citri pv. citri]|nr:hypothetical protein XAC3218_180163 [Xanthomonas citri pv. citri]CEH89678.1 hypothetical protein XACB302_2330001 [Xanthomonas citri pv. citri]CEI14754.1 hypothetical protein XACG115_510006 [Xanthomonas citri pv. citri]